MKGKSFKKVGMDVLKRVVSTMLVAMMLFTMVGTYIPAETFKADEGIDITIHFKDEAWLDDGINLYAWGNGIPSEYSSWPGKAMEVNSDNPGYYTIKLENYTTGTDINYIINGTEGGSTKQSVDSVLSVAGLTEDYECWTSIGSWNGDKFVPNVTTTAPEGWVGKVETIDITIHFKDEAWLDEGMNLYAWGDGVPSEFSGWPGKAMAVNSDNPNYYTITIEDYPTETALNYIINGKEGGSTKQSVDSVLSVAGLTEDYECWTSIGSWNGDKFVPSVTTTAPEGWSTGEPEGIDITIHFKDEAWLDDGMNVYAWGNGIPSEFSSWPGKAMTVNSANPGYYTIKIENYTEGTNINYIINGTEGGSTKQSVDSVLAVAGLTEDYECWTSIGSWNGDKFVPNVSTTAPTGWSTETQPEEPTPDVPKDPVPEEAGKKHIEIRFKNTLNWSKVNVYAWDKNGTTLNGSWPGSAISKVGDYYVWTCENWDVTQILNIIFNNGGEQTVDLALTEKDFKESTKWIFTPTSNASGKWECSKMDVPPYEKAAVAGNFDTFVGSGQSNWANDGGSNSAGVMEYLGKGYYYKKIAFNEIAGEKTAEFKITFNSSWDNAIGDANGNNYVVSVPAGSTSVEIIADTANKTIYTSVQHAEKLNEILIELGYVKAPAKTEVINGDKGTTTFVVTADTGKDVILHYALYDENSTPEFKTIKLNEKEKGVYASNELLLGDSAISYLYYYTVDGARVLDESQNIVTVNGVKYSNYTREAYAGRDVYLPGAFADASWDPGSHKMTYVGKGIYAYTYKNLPGGNYEYKVAIGGAWDPENYGANGALKGDNMSVTVPYTQDVTFYYNDFSHYTVNSIDYAFVDVDLTGTGIPASTKLTDDSLTGIYSATVYLAAGTYEDLKLVCEGKTYAFNTLTLEAGKNVNFYFDPVTGVFYNDGSNTPIDADAIYYTTKDKAYKSVYGSVEQNKEVTFTIDTGKDVTSVSLVVKGAKTVVMEKGALVDGVQKWVATTSFEVIGEFDYYFMISNGSSMLVYGDDASYAGEGKLTELTSCTPYDLIVHVEGFETPDWMKNAVIYQIFPDRFYNGNIENDKAQESARGEVDYEFVDDWYLLPENPEQKDLLTEEQYKAHGAFYGDGNWSNEIYGGDLEGIYERIDYLKALGVNVIYLNPIFSSISNHRYDACDYMEIDPILGTLGDFEDLVRFAEENGMKIILDGVFNHVSDDSIYFDRYYKFLGKSEKIGAYPYWAYVYDYMAEKSVDKATAEATAKEYFTAEYGITDYSYTEWFMVNSTTMSGTVDKIGLRAGKEVYSYEGWWGYDSMPVIFSTNGSEFQTGNWAEEIIYNEEGTSVTQYWISKGNNGWRLDVANEVSDETWQEFRESVKALDSDAVIIGEIWDDATKYLMGDMYDSVMNYVFRNAVLGFAKGESAKTAMETLERIRERYPEEAFYAMMNLVGSHDTARVLSFLDGIDDDRNQKDEASAFPTYEKTSDAAKKRQYLVALMQFTYAGAPTIYYGDEIGMVGSDDPDDRRAMEWGKGNKELVTWYATLAAIRAQHDVLRTGSVEPIVVNNNVMGYVRRDADEVMIILVNNNIVAYDVTLDLADLKVDAATLTDLLTGTKAVIENGKAVVTVPAVGGVILSETVKTYTVDQENLAPAYDSAYIGGVDLTPDEPERPEDPKPEDPKPEDPKPEDPKPEDPKPEDPKPEDPKDEVIENEGSGIDREDVIIAEDNKNNEVVKEENGKETVILGNDKMTDLTIKAETTIVDEEAFFVRQYLVEGELFEETVAQMEKKLKGVEEFKMIEINLYSGEGTQMTQLKGYVEVTIPVPTDIKVKEGNVLAVYRVNDDGSFTNCNATIKDGKLTFKTDHFSTFVIVEQAKTAVVPQTGDNSQTGVYFLVLLAGFAVAMAGVANRRKHVK